MDTRFGIAAVEAAKQRLTRKRGQVERVALRTPAEPSGMPAKFGKNGSRQVRRPRLPTVAFEAIPADAEKKMSRAPEMKRPVIQVDSVDVDVEFDLDTALEDVDTPEDTDAS